MRLGEEEHEVGPGDTVVIARGRQAQDLGERGRAPPPAVLLCPRVLARGHRDHGVGRHAVNGEPFALDPGRAALLVVDMQNDFVREGAPQEVPDARTTIPVIAAYWRPSGGAGGPWSSPASAQDPSGPSSGAGRPNAAQSYAHAGPA